MEDGKSSNVACLLEKIQNVRSFVTRRQIVEAGQSSNAACFLNKIQNVRSFVTRRRIVELDCLLMLPVY